MRNIRNLIFIHILTLTLFYVYGQTWDVKIYGNLISNDKVRLSEVPVILFENNDTVLIVKSDENGQFDFNTKFSTGNEYIIKLEVENQNSDAFNIKLFNKEDTARMSEYELDFKLPVLIHDIFDNSVYYELNEMKKFENFEIEWFKQLFIQYPGMCLEFVQTINPDEKQKIAKKRINHFRGELVKASCNMSRISF